MSYVFCTNKNEIEILCNFPIETASYTSTLGQSLISFLNLNLDDYDALYRLFSISNTTINNDDAKYLFLKFPKTTHSIENNQIEHYIEEDCYPIDLALDFILQNQDTFSEIYMHPYIAYSNTFLEGTCLAFNDVYPEANLKDIQESLSLIHI